MMKKQLLLKAITDIRGYPTGKSLIKSCSISFILPCLMCFTRGILLIRASSSPSPIGAAPHVTSSTLDRSYLSTNGCLARNRTIGGTMGAFVTCKTINQRSFVPYGDTSSFFLFLLTLIASEHNVTNIAKDCVTCHIVGHIPLIDPIHKWFPISPTTLV